VAALLLSGCIAGQTAQPKDAAGLLRQADADLAAGRTEQAQLAYEAALRFEPHLLPALRGRVESARRRGALAPIVAQAQARTEAAPQDAMAWEALGLSRFAQGQEKTAVAALARAAELQPDEADFHFRLGVALFDGEKFADARAPLSRAVELAPRAARYRPPLGACLDRLGDRKAAIAVLREVPQLSPTADEAALAVKTSRAITDPFRDVPQPARPDLELALGYLLRDAPGLSLPYLEGLVKKFPDLAAAHALLGLTAQRLDETGRAVTELQRAAELAPDQPQPHVYLAELYAARDRPELAEQEYGAALERDPLDVATLRKLGELRLSRTPSQRGAAALAIETLQRAEALAPKDAALQLTLARAEVAAGLPEPARARLEQLAEQRPEDPEVLLRLALLLFDERGKAEAPARAQLTARLEALLERVLSLQPQNAAASRMLSALRSG
jgi:tetratricopeptide (TPR) repeat protein